MTRWTEADLAKINANLRGQIQHPLGQAKPSKYHSQKTEHLGQMFDSKWECECWKRFKAAELAGGIRAVIRQVSLPLPMSRRRIRVDFLIIENNGQHRWYDAKGFETPEFKLKADVIKSAYGITIELI